MSAAERALERLWRARPCDRLALARDVLAAGVPWPTVGRLFRDAVLHAPERGERSAQALEAAAEEVHDGTAVARFRLLRGVALHRSGSPQEASRLLLEAAPRLDAVGDDTRATQSLLLAVDALAHAGEIPEALACAERARRRLRGPDAPLLRAVLRANRANALRLAGRLEEATRESLRAARDLERVGQPGNAAVARLNAGVAALYAGHLVRARGHLEAARAHFEAAGELDRTLDADYNLACLDVRDGRLGHALPALEACAATARRRGLGRREALCRMDLADALRRAGDRPGAAREARAAARTLLAAGAPAEGAEALWLAAAATAGTGRGAARDLARAHKAARTAGRRELLLRTRLLEADATFRRTGALEARALTRAAAEATRHGLVEIAWEMGVFRAAVALARGRPREAASRLDALPRAATRHPPLAAAAEGLRAAVERATGRLGPAIARLRRVVVAQGQVRSALPGAWLKTTWLLDRIDPCLALVDALLERGRAADRREAEALLDALARERFLAGGGGEVARGRVRRLRQRLEALHERLARATPPTRGVAPAQRSRWQADVRRLEREIAAAWRRDERRRPAVDAAPTARRRVATRGTTVHVWAHDGRVRALVRRGDEVVEAPLAVTSDEVAKRLLELRFHAHRVRSGLAPLARVAVERELQALARSLLQPLGDLGRSVHLVLDPRLPDIPWEVLPQGDVPLAAAVALARRPAADVTASRGRRGQGTGVIISSEESLPALGREARHVAADGLILRGRHATRAALAAALTQRRIVHVATHGVALADAPALGGVRLADGWFAAADVPARVGAAVVSLAACQTGAPPGPAGQAWDALPRALLRAGARWVLWTGGDVDDETTADLMSAFHPLGPLARVPHAFGRALAQVARDQGTVARLLPFRLSGGCS